MQSPLKNTLHCAGLVVILLIAGCTGALDTVEHPPNAPVAHLRSVAILIPQYESENYSTIMTGLVDNLVSLLKYGGYDVQPPSDTTRYLQQHGLKADALGDADMDLLAAAIQTHAVIVPSIRSLRIMGNRLNLIWNPYNPRVETIPGTFTVEVELKVIDVEGGETIWSTVATGSGAIDQNTNLEINNEVVHSIADDLVRDLLPTRTYVRRPRTAASGAEHE